jgi:hypothetical protein
MAKKRKAASFDPDKVLGPPPGSRWVHQTEELKRSAAWRERPINTIRFLEFLELEHLRKDRIKNGFLKAPWEQLVAWGIHRRFIKKAIQQAEQLGLVVTCGVDRDDDAVLYRLTYFGSPVDPRPASGPYFVQSSDEWRHYQPSKKRQTHKRLTGTHLSRKRYTKSAFEPSQTQTQNISGPQFSSVLPKPPENKCVPLYISRYGQPPELANTTLSVDPDLIKRLERFSPERRDEFLRAALRKHVGAIGHGAVTKLAREVGLRRSTLANYIAGRYRINDNAVIALFDLIRVKVPEEQSQASAAPPDLAVLSTEGIAVNGKQTNWAKICDADLRAALRQYVEAAGRGSVTRIADKLGFLKQPTISNYLGGKTRLGAAAAEKLRALVQQ